MLVLTRKQQEKIRIGDHITITVLRTKGKAVRLGIEAPTDVPVIRGELAFHDPGRDESASPPRGHESDRLEHPFTADPPPPAAEAGGRLSTWRVETRANQESARPPGNPPTQVRFERMSRQQLSQLLPRSASATGPLRGMLDRRSLTTR